MLLLMCLSDSRCALHLLSSGRKNRDAAHTNPHHKTRGRKRKQLHCFFPLILKLGFNIQVKSKTTQPQLFLCSVRCHEVTLCDRSYNVKRSHNLSNFRFQIISERPVVLTSEACCEGCKWNCTDHNKYNWLLKKNIYIFQSPGLSSSFQCVVDQVWCVAARLRLLLETHPTSGLHPDDPERSSSWSSSNPGDAF